MGLAGTPPGQPRGTSSAPSGFAPFLEAAERFAAATRSLLDRPDPSAAGNAAASQAFSNFLRDQFADFFRPPWPVQFGAGPDISTPFPTDAPALGLTREHQQRAQRAADAWRRLDEAQRRLQRLWSDTLREAATAFAARLGPPQSAALSAEVLDHLYDSWIDCAEEAYARTAHSETFCDALADYVNAGSQWRRESSAGLEQWAKLLDLPTRSEINTLAQRLRSVEEQLRQLRDPPKSPPRRRPRKAKT
jgi:Poly(R)-hydroxyalkanoic acid synthase subunit (PHA_synth_III_E)